MSAVQDVQVYLQQWGVIDGSSDWPSARYNLHERTPQLIAISDDGGAPAEIGAEQGMGDAAWAFLGVQIRVRAGEPWSADDSYAKAQEIFDLMHGLAGVVIGSTVYAQVRALSSQPVWMGFDTKGRSEHVVNLRMVRDQPAPVTS